MLIFFIGIHIFGYIDLQNRKVIMASHFFKKLFCLFAKRAAGFGIKGNLQTQERMLQSGFYGIAGISSRDTPACLAILWLTLPRKISRMYPFPWLPMTMSE